jgi:hypothetical protein
MTDAPKSQTFRGFVVAKPPWSAETCLSFPQPDLSGVTLREAALLPPGACGAAGGFRYQGESSPRGGVCSRRQASRGGKLRQVSALQGGCAARRPVDFSRANEPPRGMMRAGNNHQTL